VDYIISYTNRVLTDIWNVSVWDVDRLSRDADNKLCDLLSSFEHRLVEAIIRIPKADSVKGHVASNESLIGPTNLRDVTPEEWRNVAAGNVDAAAACVEQVRRLACGELFCEHANNYSGRAPRWQL
jgi:hypothetical protein